MHIPDGFLSAPVSIATGALAVAAVGASARLASRSSERAARMVPMMGMTAAFVFAAQMLNFPVGGGTSGHFLGAAFIAAALGGWNACLALTLVLVIQCLGFADGGITALGANVVNMAVVGGLGGYVLMRALRSALPGGRFWYLTAVAVAAWASVVLAATACAMELAISGTSPLGIALPAMAGTHAVIGVGEALITASVLSIVAAARPDVLPEWAGLGVEPRGQPARRRAWALAAVGLGAALALAALVSPFASSDPDGLEKIAEEKGFLHRAEGKESWTHSPLPDYSTPGVKSEGASTAFAGVLGTAAVFAAGFGIIRLVSGRAAGGPGAKE